MDALMFGETIDSTTGLPIWDFGLTGDATEVPMINGTEEDQQNAEVAAYLVKDGIPQLPGSGVVWLDFMSRGASFGELDSSIRQALVNIGHPEFFPGPDDWDIVNDQLKVKMTPKGGS